MDPVRASDYPEQFFSPGDAGMGVEEMLKAITAGTGTDAANFTGGRAMTLESLEGTLQDTLWNERRHIILFNKLKSSPLYAVVDEYTTRDDYGGEFGIAVGETANPPISTSAIQRHVDYCAFYRSRREVSHVATLVNMIDPGAEAAEEQSGTRQILGAVERDLFTGNRDVFPTRMRGLLTHIMAQGGDLVQDAHGAPVTTQDFFHALGGTIYSEGGYLSEVYHNPQVQADINAALDDGQRITIPVQAADGAIVHGSHQRALNYAHGQMTFNSDRFVRAGWTMQAPDVAVGPDAASIPGAPVINAVAGNAGTIATQENLPAGNYWVRVSAVCENGESIAAAAQQVVLDAGSTIRITVTPADALVTGYRVYLSTRNAVAGNDCRFNCEIAATGGQQVLEVDGTWVTGATHIFCLSMEPEEAAFDFRQLFPLTRMDLAITSPVKPFLLQLYGYPRVMKPNFHGAIINVIPSNVDWDPLT